MQLARRVVFCSCTGFASAPSPAPPASFIFVWSILAKLPRTRGSCRPPQRTFVILGSLDCGREIKVLRRNANLELSFAAVHMHEWW